MAQLPLVGYQLTGNHSNVRQSRKAGVGPAFWQSGFWSQEITFDQGKHFVLRDLPKGGRSGRCVVVVIHHAPAVTVNLVCSEVISLELGF